MLEEILGNNIVKYVLIGNFVITILFILLLLLKKVCITFVTEVKDVKDDLEQPLTTEVAEVKDELEMNDDGKKTKNTLKEPENK